VRSQRAGERVRASLTRFLAERLKLKVNAEKSAVAQPWRRKFLGYSITWHQKPKLRIATPSLKRLGERVRERLRGARGSSLTQSIEALNPLLRGWAAYFKLTETKQALETLDGWIRRTLRCVLWRQAKRVRTRARMLMKRGLTEERAWRSATNQRGPWFNAGASHMNAAFPKSWFDSPISERICRAMTDSDPDGSGLEPQGRAAGKSAVRGRRKESCSPRGPPSGSGC
jgi:RNA-directed DNA polymerase